MSGILSDEEIEKLERGERPERPLTDEEIEAMEHPPQWDMSKLDTTDRMAVKGLEAFGAGTKALGAASNALDSYTTAPIRKGIGALQNGKSAGEAFDAAKKQFGDNPRKAPTSKAIMAEAGLSPNDKIPTPFKGITGEALMVSPAGVAGFALDTAIDPLNLPVGGVARKGVQKAVSMVPKVEAYLRNAAGKNALKAAVGSGNVEHLREVLKAPKYGTRDFAEVEKKMAEVGQSMLEKDPAGKPIIRTFTTTEQAGKHAAQKSKVLGKLIGDIGETLDKAVPDGAISGRDVANRMFEYASSLPESGNNPQIRERVLEEAAKWEKKGRLTFDEAQQWKNSGYEYRAMGTDPLTTSQSATNAMERIVSGAMEDAVEANKHLNPKLMGNYKRIKKQWATVTPVAEAAADRGVKNFSNQKVTQGMWQGMKLGMGGAGGYALMHSDPGLAIVAAVAGGAAVKAAQKSGNSVMARGLQTLANIAKTSPESLKRWKKVLGSAALAAPASVVSRHHYLMQTDPAYRLLIQENGGGTDDETPRMAE